MTSATNDAHVWDRAFHSPLEAGLRSVAVLLDAYPARMDLERLVYFDYLVVHSGDVTDGPESLHPPSPYRSGELLIRRGLVEEGVALMVRHGLLERSFDEEGIAYNASEGAAPFMLSLQTEYMIRLRKAAKWAAGAYASYSRTELGQFVAKNLDRWGAEFMWASSREETIK